MKRITPVLVVPALEAVLPLWEALGFARVAEVPHGDALGFAILARGKVELMYQSCLSVCHTMPRAGLGFRPAGRKHGLAT